MRARSIELFPQFLWLGTRQESEASTRKRPAGIHELWKLFAGCSGKACGLLRRGSLHLPAEPAHWLAGKDAQAVQPPEDELDGQGELKNGQHSSEQLQEYRNDPDQYAARVQHGEKIDHHDEHQHAHDRH